jgi:hypothetical protein
VTSVVLLKDEAGADRESVEPQERLWGLDARIDDA